MCKICGHEEYSTRHLLWWQAEWFKRFWVTWWHIVNRKAYWKFLEKKGRHPVQLFMREAERYNRYFR